MSKGNTTETDFLSYIFNKTAFSWDSNLNVYIALHTADPGEAGFQNTSEATYGPYARVTVSRAASGWTVAGNQASNAALIQFPQCTGGSDVLSYVSIGTASAGAGQILYSGQLNSNLTVSNLIQPQFSTGALVIEED